MTEKDEFEEKVKNILNRLNYVGDGDYLTEEEAIAEFNALKAQILKDHLRIGSPEMELLFEALKDENPLAGLSDKQIGSIIGIYRQFHKQKGFEEANKIYELFLKELKRRK